MKRIFLLAAITISAFIMASAQGELPQVRAKKMVSKVNIACALQGEQWAKVNNAFVDYYAKFDLLEKQKATLSSGDYNNKLQSLKDNRDEQLRQTLKPEQFAKWSAAKEKTE